MSINKHVNDHNITGIAQVSIRDRFRPEVRYLWYPCEVRYLWYPCGSLGGFCNEV